MCVSTLRGLTGLGTISTTCVLSFCVKISHSDIKNVFIICYVKCVFGSRLVGEERKGKVKTAWDENSGSCPFLRTFSG